MPRVFKATNEDGSLVSCDKKQSAHWPNDFPIMILELDTQKQGRTTATTGKSHCNRCNPSSGCLDVPDQGIESGPGPDSL